MEDFPRCFEAENIELYRSYYKSLQKGLIQSGHDLSEGGLLVALAECLLDSGLGASIEIDENDWSIGDIFNESPGRFIVSIRSNDANIFEQAMSEHFCQRIGQVTDENNLRIDSLTIDLSASQLKEAFTREF